MSSRPRRSAAAKAKEVISVHARWADMSEKEDAGTTMSSRRTGRGAASRDTASSPEETHSSVTVKLPTSKPRQSTRGGNRRGVDAFEGGEIVHGKRNRGAKKSYVIDSSPDDEEEEEEEEVEVEEDDDEDDEDDEDARADDDDEMEELGDEDAEGEDEMDVDAEGEDDIDVAPKAAGRPSAKNSRSTKPRPTVKVTNSRARRDEDEDDEDDDELSEPADSDIGDDTIVYGDQTMGDDEDAEGEEIEVAGDEDDMEEEEEEEEEEVEEEEEDDEMTLAPGANGGDSDLDSEGGSRAETPDLAKMTKRQRARFEDIPQEFMKLPDEIQVKKVFTAEELSMRRQEMARRRRNLSEKRNEEVKMETINKLLKKQAPKINRKAAAAAAADSQGSNAQKPDPVFIRWVSNKSGNRIAVPDEIVDGPSGTLFGNKTKQPSAGPPKLVTEVA